VRGGTPGWQRRGPALNGRRAECDALDRLVESVRGGDSRALVLHGEAGVGKTALLDYLAAHAPDCQVARAAGVQSEMELPFAVLHQLCAPMLDHVAALPAPQRDALRSIFGLSAEPTPDRFLIGLAMLSLLSTVAEKQPLVCLVDDQQWLDRASAQVLAFAARRLGAESIGLVFATRNPGGDLAGLPDLLVAGLPDADARVLLDAALAVPIDGRIRDQIIAEARGNPLALLELPRELTPESLAGGFGLPGARPLARSLEQNFERRIAALPSPSRRLLLLAAADPTGDPALVWRAAAALGIEAEAAGPAAEAGLAEFGTRLRFRHPLARSAAYQSATVAARQRAHRALAEATDAELDPDRRAWHRAQATSGADEEVAAELERSASRAASRGGVTAAAAFLERATALTLAPDLRAARALAAAEAKIQAGALDAAQDLLAAAEDGPLGELGRARADVARAQLAFITSRGAEAAPLLVNAASRLADVDPALSRTTYLDALSAAIFAGRLAAPGGGVLAVARAAARAPVPKGREIPGLVDAPGAAGTSGVGGVSGVSTGPGAADLLLGGMTVYYNEGPAAGVPLLRRSLTSFGDERPPVADDGDGGDALRWLWLSVVAGAMRIWDHDLMGVLSARHVRLARGTGALSELPLALTSRAYFHLFAGELGAAAALAQELGAVMEATGIALAPYAAVGVAAFQGNGTVAGDLIDATLTDAARRGEGVGITITEWANAALNNGLGRYDQALAASRHAFEYEDDLGSLLWSAPELVEAAARTGDAAAAARGYAALTELTTACGTDWGLGVLARSGALVTEGEEAEGLYRESITRLGRTRLRVDLARARLLYGEWLRRERRRGDAREQLRPAYEMFQAMGMAGFAERAGRELRSTGETARKRAPAARHQELTAQETLIAGLARDGLSNPEIGTRLFLSAHTVQYHLRKIFAKLGIASRSQLSGVLPNESVGS
jgi:DNA-binding CsgD family transcriptional regulator